MNPLLRLESVAFGYGPGMPLFEQVTLDLAPGELVGLLGPNGAGKTTLLRLASGVLAPQAGRVLLGGRDLVRLGRRAVAQRIAVVPQEVALPFAYTVRQLVELGRTPHLPPLGWGMLGAADRAAVADALARTATADLADRVFNELSGGERQRVLIAMALAQSPELLLLDEPTAHLDVKHQIAVLDLVAHLNRAAGVTVLASFHDLNLAARYFPRLVVFQRGIVADGPPSAVLDPALLERVYGVRVRVGVVRGGRHLSVALPGEDEAMPGTGAARAHVVAGGGTGDLVMRALVEAGIAFTAGPLNIGDSDHGLAAQVAASVIELPPYAAVRDADAQAAELAMTAAGLAILCPAPLGPGNVATLRAALRARAAGGTVWLFEPTLPLVPDPPTPDTYAAHVRNRDYADGLGAALAAELLAAGARLATSLPELMAGLAAHDDEP